MPRKTDPQIEIANEIYKDARKQADQEIAKMKSEVEAIREESQTLGILRKIEYDITHNKVLKYVVLHRIKQAKDYREGGMTWAQFCEAIGESVRSVDSILTDLQPIAEGFSEKFADFAGLPFNKIRYLGRVVSGNSAEIEDGVLIVGDQKISLVPENKDEIETLIRTMKEASREQAEEASNALRAKDRILESKEQVINRQEKEIARHEARNKAKGFAPGEEEFLKQLETTKVSVDGHLIKFQYDTAGSVRSDLTPRMKVALLETLAYIRKIAAITHEDVKDLFGEMEEPWDPDAEIAAFEEEQRKNSHDA